MCTMSYRVSSLMWDLSREVRARKMACAMWEVTLGFEWVSAVIVPRVVERVVWERCPLGFGVWGAVCGKLSFSFLLLKFTV